MTDPHLNDDRLIEICSTGGADAAESMHLSLCGRCQARRSSIVEILEELDEAASAEADAVFPPDRLARQQARILTRVGHDGRPGRLITFPAHQQPDPMFQRSRPHTRVAAAVAAAAFVMGVLAGHFVHDFPRQEAAAATQVVVANETDSAPLRAVSTTFSEDEFLNQIEVAAVNGPTALRPLDAMTPRSWEVR